MGLILMERGNYMEAVEAFKTRPVRPDGSAPAVNVGVAYDRTGCRGCPGRVSPGRSGG